ncbi:MAG: sigma-54-dependent Fis family transcriptional regulator [Proteobacteria bacterium]|nr:sigma-54-dependent Fis family transcriptional regulator [Pseudomonadota bacterium]MCP4916379.1 sigma-54-dependent Fis family transcriptional regulator [Pseudomonadota bacterium]
MELQVVNTLTTEVDDVLSAWEQAYRDVGGRASSDQFRRLFRPELEGLQGGPLVQVLESTGTCASRWGIPLDELVAAAASFDSALPDRQAPDSAAELRLLERERVAAYVRAFTRASRLNCSRRSSRRGPKRTFGLVGASRAATTLLQHVRQAAAAPGHVLVTGETGVGKSLVVRAIHEASRPAGPLVVVECSSLPRDIAEVELFGCVAGAFHGSGEARPGLIRASRGGTLHLEDITEMPPSLQAKLRRFLDDQVVRPLGTSKGIPVDVRVVATTAQDPDEAVAKGTLRSDLRYRLGSLTVRVPTLDERRDDIPDLAEWFLASFCNRHCDCIRGLTPAALEVLVSAPWPGNVRQLKNAIEHAILRGTTANIRPDDLPADLSTTPTGSTMTLAEAEQQHIQEALERCHGNKAQCAKDLGISRNKLYSVLKKIEA